MTENRQWRLRERPKAAPDSNTFELVDTPLPVLGSGQCLCRTIWLSLDPYMRGRIREGASYAAPLEIGEVMTGETVAKVVISQSPEIKEGSFVLARGGWQEYFTADADAIRVIDPQNAPISTALGVLGMPGLTAYSGLLAIGEPQQGETVVVPAASGAVGAVAGQIAKIKGCKVIGIAGGPEKCTYVKSTLGFDDCLDRREPGLPEKLQAACPDGIDIYIELVGGKVFEAVLPLLNMNARIPVIGGIAHYNASELPPGPDHLPFLMRQTLVKRLLLRGMIVWDYAHMQEDFLREVGGWIREGRLSYKEDVVQGLENAPDAFNGLLEGKNFGKLLVHVSPDPTR